MHKAKDIMTRDVISVTKDTPVIEVMKLMEEHDITGLPVVEEDMTLVGIVSEKDLLKLVHPWRGLENKVVSDFMTQPAIHFDKNENILEVFDCLAENSFRRVPVTSEGKLVGIISRPEVIKYILKLREKEISAGRVLR